MLADVKVCRWNDVTAAEVTRRARKLRDEQKAQEQISNGRGSPVIDEATEEAETSEQIREALRNVRRIKQRLARLLPRISGSLLMLEGDLSSSSTPYTLLAARLPSGNALLWGPSERKAA